MCWDRVIESEQPVAGVAAPRTIIAHAVHFEDELLTARALRFSTPQDAPVIRVTEAVTA